MKVPEQLALRVNCDEEADLSDIIVEMLVATGRKSPYHIYFPKTNRAGVSSLTRDDFIGQFTDEWESGLMDHSGTLGEASPTVHVQLYDPSWSLANRTKAIAWPLMKHERTKWRTREQQYEYRISTRNPAFEATELDVDVEKTTEIVIHLRRRPGT